MQSSRAAKREDNKNLPVEVEDTTSYRAKRRLNVKRIACSAILNDTSRIQAPGRFGFVKNPGGYPPQSYGENAKNAIISKPTSA